ncbi:MAG: hypothetical protein AB7R90_09850 [Reyranellaceae bacterium]
MRRRAAAWPAAAVFAAVLACASSATAGLQEELVAAKEAYVAAKQEEKAAHERLDRAAAAAAAAEAKVAQAAREELAKAQAIEQRKQAAERELLALLERRAEIELEVAGVRDLAAEARRAYDQAQPIYLIVARTQQLSDYPEWKAIERRASETALAATRAVEAARPRIAAVDKEIEAKQRQVLAIEAEFAQPVVPLNQTLMRAWLEAGIDVAIARRDLAAAERALTAAFDRYLAKLGPARPPYLEAVTADIGIRTVYRGVWQRRKEGNEDDAARIAALRAARDELDGTITERQREADEARQHRLEIAESMHGKALRFVAAEERRYDAQFKKIAFAALAEMGGTIVEVALTGGVATAVRKAGEITEEKVAELAAQKLLRNSAPLAEEASEAAARLALRSEQAFARQVRTAYAEAERLAVEAAARRVQRTGEALDVATIDARRQLQRALKGLADTDPAIRAEAVGLARRLLGERAVIVLEPLLQAAAGKKGGGALADLLHSGGAGGDPIGRLSAPDAASGSSNVAADVKSVVMGDIYEQGIARGLSYAISVAPDAGRAGLEGLRQAAAANASNWRQIASGSKEFLKGGVDLAKFKDAMKGTARGNLVGLATTGAKAMITAHYGAQEEAAGRLAYELYAAMTVEQNLLTRLQEAGRKLEDDLKEARRLRAEIDTYLALLGSPRELDVTDDPDDVDPAADLVVLLRFSAAIDKAPKATAAGIALDLQAQQPGAEGAALWKATLKRAQLPADAASVPLVVELAPGTGPFPTLDSDPATPARPDPRTATPGADATKLEWIALDAGPDRHHKIVVRDPWTGIWTRGNTRIRITRRHYDLTGVVETAGEPGRSERGFAAGETVMRGSIGRNRTAQVELLARYDKEWRGKCPASAGGYWSPGRYTLDPAGVLAGEWEDRQLDAGCKIAEAVTQKDTLRREAAR